MEFIETSWFGRLLPSIMDDDSYATLQQALAEHPDAGDIIKHSGGIRKLRWACGGRGKRGGCRIIYYWRTAANTILFLDIYAKNERSDLSPAQLKMLAAAVKKELQP